MDEEEINQLFDESMKKSRRAKIHIVAGSVCGIVAALGASYAGFHYQTEPQWGIGFGAVIAGSIGFLTNLKYIMQNSAKARELHAAYDKARKSNQVKDTWSDIIYTGRLY